MVVDGIQSVSVDCKPKRAAAERAVPDCISLYYLKQTNNSYTNTNVGSGRFRRSHSTTSASCSATHTAMPAMSLYNSR